MNNLRRHLEVINGGGLKVASHNFRPSRKKTNKTASLSETINSDGVRKLRRNII